MPCPLAAEFFENAPRIKDFSVGGLEQLCGWQVSSYTFNCKLKEEIEDTLAGWVILVTWIEWSRQYNPLVLRCDFFFLLKGVLAGSLILII